MNFAKQVKELRDAGIVQRFHTARVLRHESVAEHSFNVAQLVMALTCGQASRDLILAALMHDMGEYKTGDIPSPVKLRLPPEVAATMESMEVEATKELHPGAWWGLTPVEERILAIADRLDGLMKCVDELKMGNRHIIPIGNRYVGYLMRYTDDDNHLRQEVAEIIHLWNTELLK